VRPGRPPAVRWPIGERTSYRPGTFCWVELATPDPPGALAFYRGLLGWEGDAMPAGPQPGYTMVRSAGRYVAALHHDGRGTAPAWLSFVSVADVDEAAERAAGLGGLVVQGPADVLDAGRLAVVADPTGAQVALWQPGRHIGATLVNEPGALCMNQLDTSDPDAALGFYGELFGWTARSVGSAEEPYWSLFNAGSLNGGLRPVPPDAGPARWLAYFAVADLDAVVAGIGAAGGAVVAGPRAVPAGRFVVATDPQGAAFAVFEGPVDP